MLVSTWFYSTILASILPHHWMFFMWELLLTLSSQFLWFLKINGQFAKDKFDHFQETNDKSFLCQWFLSLIVTYCISCRIFSPQNFQECDCHKSHLSSEKRWSYDLLDCHTKSACHVCFAHETINTINISTNRKSFWKNVSHPYFQQFGNYITTVTAVWFLPGSLQWLKNDLTLEFWMGHVSMALKQIISGTWKLTIYINIFSSAPFCSILSPFNLLVFCALRVKY